MEASLEKIRKIGNEIIEAIPVKCRALLLESFNAFFYTILLPSRCSNQPSFAKKKTPLLLDTNFLQPIHDLTGGIIGKAHRSSDGEGLSEQ